MTDNTEDNRAEMPAPTRMTSQSRTPQTSLASKTLAASILVFMRSVSAISKYPPTSHLPNTLYQAHVNWDALSGAGQLQATTTSGIAETLAGAKADRDTELIAARALDNSALVKVSTCQLMHEQEIAIFA